MGPDLLSISRVCKRHKYPPHPHIENSPRKFLQSSSILVLQMQPKAAFVIGELTGLDKLSRATFYNEDEKGIYVFCTYER